MSEGAEEFDDIVAAVAAKHGLSTSIAFTPSGAPAVAPMPENPTAVPKTRCLVRCDVCNLEFSSQTVLESHNSGSKHQKKVRCCSLCSYLITILL